MAIRIPPLCLRCSKALVLLAMVLGCTRCPSPDPAGTSVGAAVPALNNAVVAGAPFAAALPVGRYLLWFKCHSVNAQQWRDVLERLEQAGCTVERPDHDGPVIIVSGKVQAAINVAKQYDLIGVESIQTSAMQICNEPAGVTVCNLAAGRMHRVDELCQKYGLTGQGIAVGIWDQGPIDDHVEFAGRVSYGDTSREPRSNHATHVAGTIAARGIAHDAKGMAVNAAIVSHDWNNDLPELVRAARDRSIRCSNHSYGPCVGFVKVDAQLVWYGPPDALQDPRFATYSVECAQLDCKVRDLGYMVVCFAAGNARGVGQSVPGESYKLGPNGPWVNDPRPSNGGVAGYFTISPRACAKNCIAVAAISDLEYDTAASGGFQLEWYSGFGPTRDGRIKPDIAAKGESLYSPKVGNGNYGWLSGTSMATPVVTGTCALLHELYAKTHQGGLAWSEEIKAAIIHSAVRVGGDPQTGPNPRSGWGALDALEAGKLIAGDRGTKLRVATSGSEIRYEWERKSGDDRDIRTTLVWNDAPFYPDPSRAESCLVVDLNAVLVDPKGRQWFPWSLDRKDPGKPASRAAANHRDNVEVIDVSGTDAVAGRWSLVITGPTGDNRASLVVTGLRPLEDKGK